MTSHRLFTRIRELRQMHARHRLHLLSNSLRHLSYLSAIAVPVSLLHIVFFWSFNGGSPAEQRWHDLIILAHGIQIVLFGTFGPAAWFLSKRADTAAAKMLLWLSLLAIVGTGIGVATIDQLVTSAVTPFLVACTVAGLLYQIAPWQALPFFSATFVAYFFALSLTQTSPEILLSNQVNGLTAAGIAVGLSLAMWYNALVRRDQQQQIEQQKRALELANKTLTELATRDALTGLLNRRLFDMILQEELTASARSQASASLLMIDLDHFKKINDDYGHLAGDQILKQVATLLAASLRAADMVGRWGGEEFVVLLRNTGADAARDVAETLRQRISSHTFLSNRGEHHVTVSVGVAELNPNAENALHDGYERADRALYTAKAAGRDRVRIFSQLMPL